MTKLFGPLSGIFKFGAATSPIWNEILDGIG